MARRTTTTAHRPASSATVADSSTTTTTTSALAVPATTEAPGAGTASKPVFLALANAICKNANTRTKAVGDSLPTDPSGSDQANALDEGADIVAAAITQMQHLDQPSGDRRDLVRFYQLSQQLLVLTRQLADAFRADDAKTASSIEAAGSGLDDDLTKAADAYGLGACGSGSSS